MKKIAFVHIPKTGGKYIQLQAYKNNNNFLNLGHKGFIRFNKNIDGDEKYEKTCLDYDLEDYILFSVIRNPFEMLVSAYFHNYSNQNGWDNCIDRFNFYSFDNYVKRFCDLNEKFYRPMFRNFLFWQLFDETGKCRVDYIIRNEYLDEGLKILGEKTGIKPILGDRIGSSNKNRNYKDYLYFYNDELIYLVNKKCKDELILFDYSVEGCLNNNIFIDNNIQYNIGKYIK